MIDILIAVFVAAGAIIGYWRGAFAGVVLLLATYVPMGFFVLYYDKISGFVQLTLSNSGNATTSALGGLGAFSGIIALFGLSGALFFGTRIMLKIVEMEKPDRAAKIGGAVIGVISHNLIATLIFFFFYNAVPATTTSVIQGSYWQKALYPIHKLLYPPYVSLVKTRTQAFSDAIAQDGFGQVLVGGVSLAGLNEAVGFDAPSLSSALTDIKELADTINIDEVNALIETAQREDLSPEEIDRRISAEQEARRRYIDSQLR